MKVTDHLDKAKNPFISFEIIPPLRGGKVQGLMDCVEDLAHYHPPFIDITSHSAVVSYSETPEGIKKHVRRKRPGTLGICALLQNKYNIDAVPHVLCTGFTREETEDFLIELNYLGIDNVLAIRGDHSSAKKKLTDGRTANDYAHDLVAQIHSMNAGDFLEGPSEATGFCVGVAGYPEKHFEAPNMEEDIRQLKKKVDAGAAYIVTQMFFDNAVYFSFVEQCRNAGITVPIIPGLKILTSPTHLKSIPSIFHCNLPEALVSEASVAKPEHFREIGVNWALKQTQELLEKGVPSVHFYVMQSSRAINALMQKLSL